MTPMTETPQEREAREKEEAAQRARDTEAALERAYQEELKKRSGS